ncbi:hypothetical protein D9M73_172620 [compost metagenome]
MFQSRQLGYLDERKQPLSRHDFTPNPYAANGDANDFPGHERLAPAPCDDAHGHRVHRRRDVDLCLGVGLSNALFAVSVHSVSDRPDRLPASARLFLLAAPAIGTRIAATGAGAGQPGDRPASAVQGGAAVSGYRDCAVYRLRRCAADDERDERSLRRG